MVATIDLGMDRRRAQARAKFFRGKEIVDAPASVLLASLEAVTPPRIDVLLVREEIAESVDKATFEQEREFVALLVGEARVATVG